LQTWHKNKPWRGKLTEIDNIKVESAKKKVKPQQREASQIAKKVKQRCSLKSHPSSVSEMQRELRLIYASIVKHDHDYCKVGEPADYVGEQLQQNTDGSCTQLANETSTMLNIELATRGQRNNPLWHAYCQYRITSSIARKLLHSTECGRPNLINRIMNIQAVHNEENIPLPCYMG
jgi:hypothetical protein